MLKLARTQSASSRPLPVSISKRRRQRKRKLAGVKASRYFSWEDPPGTRYPEAPLKQLFLTHETSSLLGRVEFVRILKNFYKHKKIVTTVLSHTPTNCGTRSVPHFV